MKYLSDYMESKQTELFEATGAFFAFSNSQFDEKRKEGVKYANLGAGLISPLDQVEILRNGLDEIYNEALKQDFEENGAEAIIRREYFNHEYQLTCDNLSILEDIAPYKKFFAESFKDEFVKSIAKKCFNEAVENDWF